MRTTVRKKKNLEYDLVIERLHLYYDMKLVTFGIDDKNLIVQFPVFIQPYTATTHIISDRHCTSSNYRPKYTGAILHTSADG